MSRAALSLLAALPFTVCISSAAHAQFRGAHPHHPAAQASHGPITIVQKPRVQEPRRVVIVAPIRPPVLPGPALSLAPTAPQTVETVRIRSRREAVQPLSIHAIDPFTIVSRSPSGRVVLTSTQGYGGFRGGVHQGREYQGYRRHAAVRTPYAPPAFHIIGAPTGRNMSTPVKLSHGIAPHRRFQTEPKVVFLQDSRQKN